MLVLLLVERCSISKSARRGRRSALTEFLAIGGCERQAQGVAHGDPIAVQAGRHRGQGLLPANIARQQAQQPQCLTNRFHRLSWLPVLPLAALVTEFFPQQARGVVGDPAQPLLHGLVAFLVSGSAWAIAPLICSFFSFFAFRPGLLLVPAPALLRPAVPAGPACCSSSLCPVLLPVSCCC